MNFEEAKYIQANLDLRNSFLNLELFDLRKIYVLTESIETGWSKKCLM